VTQNKLSARARANRANARKSTGPKTAEGRARVSRNAIKHGLSSADPPAHKPDVVLELIAAMLSDYQLTDSETACAYPIAYRAADALLTLLKIRAIRNEHWRRLNDLHEAQDEPEEPSTFAMDIHRILTRPLVKQKQPDVLTVLRRLERYELRAATRFHRASKALADMVAALPARADGKDPPSE
jgi:hypothetical protein